MTIQDIGSIGEFIGSMLILVTLVYLAIQNRHQQKLLLSTAFQARLDPLAKYIGWRVENPQFAEVLRKNFAGDSLTDMESLQLEAYSFFGISMLENAMYQKNLGALDVSDTEVESQIGILMRETSRESLEQWKAQGYFPSSFQSELDRFLEKSDAS